jgi:hypothetical protein
MKSISFPISLLKQLDPNLYEELKAKLGPDGMIDLEKTTIPMHILKELIQNKKLQLPKELA